MDRKSILGFLIITFSIILLNFSDIHSQTDKVLPDYEKHSPFVNLKSDYSIKLYSLVTNASSSSDDCESGIVKVPNLFDYQLKSNICNKNDFLKIRTTLHSLVPTLNQKNITFWKTDINNDNEAELLVGYIEISKDDDKYPYLSLWLVQFEKDHFKVSYFGPFLNGEVHAIKKFGPNNKNKIVFIRHQSCIECHPWIYLTPIDFLVKSKAAAYEFTYSEDHKEFGTTVEYELPGEGHSVDATVDTRIIQVFSNQGPHLMQRFELEEGENEWWVFTCKGLKCDYKMYEGKLPQQYKTLWDKAEKL